MPYWAVSKNDPGQLLDKRQTLYSLPVATLLIRKAMQKYCFFVM